MGEKVNTYRVRWETLKERGYTGDKGVDGKIKLKWIFKK
jgi:restriction endonuclease Mrr